MYWDEINKLSKKIITIGAKNKVLISTAESCTGGMIGSVNSAFFDKKKWLIFESG